MGQQVEFALRQSVHRVLVVLVSFLPGILAFLLAVALFLILGALLAALVRRCLTALHFDDRLSARTSQGNATDWVTTQSPTLLISRAVFWTTLLVGIALGITAFDASYSANSQVSLFLLPYVTHLIGAVLLLLAGTLFARFLARSVLIGAVNAGLQYARFLALGVKWLVLVLTAAMALDHLRIGGAVVELAFGILFGGIVLTLALAIGLGSRELVSRSLERSMERPTGPTEVSPVRDTDLPERPKLRHF